MKESVIIQKLIQVGQMLERGQLEYSGAEADTIYFLEQYLALRQPLVSGSLPLSDADKLAIAWKTLEWVGFSRGVEFKDDDVIEMLGGNDR